MSLDKWCKALNLLPLSEDETKQVFRDMLVHCKISKFWEVNYKILTRILATPVVIAAVHNNPSLSWYYWCGARANIEHILLHCNKTRQLRIYIQKAIGKVEVDSWIFCGSGKSSDTVIWISNFVIYKSHLLACHGIFKSPLELFLQESVHFLSLYPSLQDFIDD